MDDVTACYDQRIYHCFESNEVHEKGYILYNTNILPPQYLLSKNLCLVRYFDSRLILYFLIICHESGGNTLSSGVPNSSK